MYYCTECNNRFEEKDIIEKTTYDTLEFWGSKVQVPHIVGICPYCYSEYIEEDDYSEYVEEEFCEE